jgi:hypothetical protein
MFDSKFFHIVLYLAVSQDMLLEWILHSHNKIWGKFVSYVTIVLFEPW